MRTWTVGQLIQKVRADLDLQDEQFITPDEMVGYVNEAIHEAESLILTINEDYLLTGPPADPNAYLALTQGKQVYALPANIYAQKIRRIYYNYGTIQYNIMRIRGQHKFEIAAMIDTYGLADDYMYDLVNPTGSTQAQVVLHPPSRETSSQSVQFWYIRSAVRVPQASELVPPQAPTAPNSPAQTNLVLDIPEFTTFLIDFVKYKCLLKDTDPRLSDQQAIMLNQRQMMVDTLTEKVPDDDSRIVADMSFYVHMS